MDSQHNYESILRSGQLLLTQAIDAKESRITALKEQLAAAENELTGLQQALDIVFRQAPNVKLTKQNG